MGEDRHSIEVSLLGSSFTIQSKYDPAYMAEVIGFLQGKIREVQTGSTIKDNLKIALLAALNVVDELFRLKARPEESDSREIKEITERLIETIDKNLVEN